MRTRLAHRNLESGRELWTTLTLVFLFTLTVASAQSAFQAGLDRDTITVGESAAFTLTFEGKAPNLPPAIPSIPNLEFSYSGKSSQFSIVNGQTSASQTFTYRVVASAPGDYTIPAIDAVIDGRKLSTRALRLRVLKSDPSSNAAAPRAAFFKVILPKEQLYIGETFPIELQLYASNPHDLQMPQMKADGFTMGTMTQAGRTQAQASGMIYSVFLFKVAATAAKTGMLKIGPAECSLVIRYRKPRDPNDPFGEFFGGGVELRQATVRSEPVTIGVLPLPGENQPADFTGAVGDFSLTVVAGPTNVMVGDPITVTIKISGEGALDALALPPLQWSDFTLYQPNAKTEPSDPLGIRGAKTFEQVVIPQNAEIKQLPAIRFSFFDPQRKNYRTVQQPAIPIQVRSNPATAPVPSIAAPNGLSEDESARSRDIVHIKPQLGSISSNAKPLIQQAWFLGVQGVPLLVWLAAMVWRKRRDLLARDPRLRRRLQVNQLVRTGLQDLRRFAAEHRPEPFFAAAFRLLQEQLGERLNLPATGITESVIDEHLRLRAASENLIADLHDLFQICNQARYAPNYSVRELMSIVPRVESILKRLAALQEPATV